MSVWAQFFEYWGDVFSLIGWKDLLDIVLVSIVFYRFVILLQGTRTLQLFFGLAALFFVFWLSDRFEIRTIHAILANVFDNLFIVFIVLFQSDIRRVFSQVGRRSGSKTSDLFKDGGLLEELVRGCVSLANKKIGGLIVLERDANVLDFVEPGVMLDSTLTKELLTSIFLPVSPIHDGAVLIRKGRVHMAGCFLPLSLNPLISKSLGTRHRAALGLTEETDAICIVMSEENGSISLASHGKILHNLDGADLRKHLLEGVE